MSTLFNNIENNRQMIEGAYKKFKSFYYYNKNALYIREKIADFENNRPQVNKTFDILSKLLKSPNANKYENYLTELINNIDFLVYPKSFTTNEVKADIITNILDKDKDLEKVNFFIDMPIELHILDTLWTIYCGRIAKDSLGVFDNLYGNIIDESISYNDNNDFFESINFNKRRFFKFYFNEYTRWRNYAFDKLAENYEEKIDSILISLDLRNYYYSVHFNFSKISKYFNDDVRFKEMKPLTKIVKSIFLKYTCLIQDFRTDIKTSKNESIFPIGLFSSMLLSNIYLKDFDKKFDNLNLDYYGRYVDDVLLVYKTNKLDNFNLKKILRELFVDNDILHLNNNDSTYSLTIDENLKIQESKIKVLYIDSAESRTILDIYEQKIRINPSMVNMLPGELNIKDFDESAYMVDNWSAENKIRDIGQMSINSFRVNRYLSDIVRTQKNINEEGNDEVTKQYIKIRNFFKGNQAIEYYNSWINIFYFLVLNNDKKQIVQLYRDLRNSINLLKKPLNGFVGINNKRKITLMKKLKDSLKQHLKISMCSAFALDISLINENKIEWRKLSRKLLDSNMFNHYLAKYPLMNLCNLDGEISLINPKMKMCSPQNFSSFKLKWMPRFVKLEELFNYNFLNNYMADRSFFSEEQIDEIIREFYEINENYGEPFTLNIHNEDGNRYQKHIIKLDLKNKDRLKIKIAVANIKITELDCAVTLLDSSIGLIREKKELLFNILKQAVENEVDFLLLPEFYLPALWLNEVMEFTRKTEIVVITGLQYLTDDTQRAFNYVATILPFKVSKYVNVIPIIREKNHYAPIEKYELAELGFTCNGDNKIPVYDFFEIDDIKFGLFLCFEFTDIEARSIYKNNADILFIPQFNKDTSYFSNIVESLSRDNHCFIVQANTSIFGDSRITAPYNSDYKNIVQLKGGDNDGIIVGTIDIVKLKEYQDKYYSDEDTEIKQKLLDSVKIKDKRKYLKEKIEKREYDAEKRKIKKLPAKYST
ncbi:hypothetical protein FRZ06_04195 [Anoxybacterium hadale]|uniref:Uncharacterized protein n=1 Tax=Anoxybacterium hadale TaxID=3408580 RepID=A0ACD1A8C7_9FIRM|nr:hypothetical protein FRZ06_04195 [Clostridiales bacterium]